VVKKCDMRGSDLGFSGSMGNATRITESDIYGNVSGIVLDTLSASGHPGFPADSSQIDHNNIYSNNLDVYEENSPVDPLVAVPTGTGIIYAGMNDANIHHNNIFDNWGNGTLLLAVPDALTTAGGGEGEVYDGISCPGAPENGISTSCGNRYHDNVMGRVPQGFDFPRALDQFGVPHGTINGDSLPNGTDFWWDEFSGNTRNCWFDNVGADGTAGSVTGPGDAGRLPGSPPAILPSDCATSVGPGDVAKTQYLIDCSEGPDEDTGPTDCDWWDTPPEPGTKASAQEQRQAARAAARFEESARADRIRERVAALTG
jgi:hypothetical protein